MTDHSIRSYAEIGTSTSPPSFSTLPNLESFFPLDSSLQVGKSKARDRIARDIVMLSTLLTNVQRGDSIVSPSNSTVEIWSQVAFILTIVDEHDQYGHPAIAVTGRVEPGRIVAAVVACNASLRYGKQSPLPVDVMKSPHVSPRETIDMLEHRSYKNTVSFDDHLRDVSSIINILLLPIRSNDPEKAIRHHVLRIHMIFEFAVRRCWRKLRARVKMGVRIWGEHPLLSIYNYYRDPSEPRSSLQPFTFVLPPGPYLTVLRANGIIANADDQDASTYTLSDATVHTWAKFPRSCYDPIK